MSPLKRLYPVKILEKKENKPQASRPLTGLALKLPQSRIV